MWQVPRRLPESAAATTTNTPGLTSLCRSTRTRPLPVSLHPHTTPVPQPCQRGLRLLPKWFRHVRFTSCAHPSLLSHNIIFQTGRRPNGRCLRFLVRYIYMRFRPTPAEFNGATTAFLRPNRPRCTQPEHPRTHLPPHHQPPEPRPPSFYDYQLHPRD